MTISTLLQLKVQEKVQQCLDLILGEDVARYLKVQIEFKKTLGLCAALAYNGNLRIVINEPLFLANQDDYFNEIIPHEVCHIVQYVIYPDELITHGIRWKELMSKLGLEANVYHDLDISAVDSKVFRYTCCCGNGTRYHQVPESRHKKLQQGKVQICGGCSTRIIYFPRDDYYGAE